MTYEDLLKSGNWVQSMDSSYFNTMGAKVLIFKLDKKATKINPIYNEEIDGRKYLRPFELKSIYKTNPFEFSFDNTIPSETEKNISFYFNFNSMVQIINNLKQNVTTLVITANDNGWSIVKTNDMITLYNKSFDTLEYPLNEYTTISELAQALVDTGKFVCKYEIDDYTRCIPNFKETRLSNAIKLKTVNRSFIDATYMIDQGDLIYVPTINALYEVTSSYPVNNTMYRYTNWVCNAQRTFAYVEYEKLKTYQYGFGYDDEFVNSNSDSSISHQEREEYNIATDEQIRAIINDYARKGTSWLR